MKEQFLYSLEERNQKIREVVPDIISADEPIVLAELGEGKPLVAITAGTHGDEEIGFFILHALSQTLDIQNGTVRFVLANPPALAQGVRYVHDDLNRSYPGNFQDRGERKLAIKVLEIVNDSDYTIDLHSTSATTEPFVIVGRRNLQRIRFAEATGIQKIVLFEGETDVAMVDFVKCGIGIELGLHRSTGAYEAGISAVTHALGSFGMLSDFRQQKVEQSYYEVFGTLLKPQDQEYVLNPSLQNFVEVKQGELIASGVDGSTVTASDNFYPVLAGEQSYTNMLAIKARAITRKEMIGGQHD